MINRLEEAMTEYWGPRCPDHEPDCLTCKAWGELDKYTAEYNNMYHVLKRLRIVLMQAGYYDEVQGIDKFMQEINDEHNG